MRGLSYNRLTGYTAADLNSFWNDFISNFNGVLPNGIQIQNGNAFSDLSVSEVQEIATGINTPTDILEAISYLAERLSSNGSNSDDDELSNSSWGYGVVPTDTISSTPTWTSFVTPKLDDEDIALSQAFGSALTGSTYTMTPIGIEQFQTQYTSKGEILSVLTSIERTVGSLPNLQNTNNSTIVGSWGANTFLGQQNVATKNVAVLGNFINQFYSQGAVQPLSNSGGATWQQTSFAEEVVDDGLSDNYTLPKITKETFDGVDFDNWVVTSSALTTVTIETFDGNDGIVDGVVGWFQTPKNNPSRITFENFSDGYDLGTYPTRICSGSSSGSGDGNEITENITSQINGITQSFTLTNDYVSGSLRVYWNGQRQIVGDTITETGNNTLSTTFLPLVGQYLIVDYVISTS